MFTAKCMDMSIGKIASNDSEKHSIQCSDQNLKAWLSSTNATTVWFKLKLIQQDKSELMNSTSSSKTTCMSTQEVQYMAEVIAQFQENTTKLTQHGNT